MRTAGAACKWGGRKVQVGLRWGYSISLDRFVKAGWEKYEVTEFRFMYDIVLMRSWVQEKKTDN